MALASMAGKAESPDIIFNQPEGQLRIYSRSGSTLTENSETSELEIGEQGGTMSIVYAEDGTTVYLQDPVSGYTMSGSWVRGKLEEGKIIVPLGQYIDYTRSFDMAYQLVVLKYDEDSGSYVWDESTTEVTYRLGEEGTIRLEGTSQEHILGLIFRTFGHPQGAAIGQDFMYLNYQWIGVGDWDSSYTLMDLQVQQPPSTLETVSYHATSAEYDGAAYSPYKGTAVMGQSANEIWVRGIVRLMPSAWIKGTVGENGKVVFPTGQFLGTIEGIGLFLHGASLNAENSFNIKDLEAEITEDGLVTYDFLFLTTSATALEYVNFYMGMTLSEEGDRLVETPTNLTTAAYHLTYASENGVKEVKESPASLWGKAGERILKKAAGKRQVSLGIGEDGDLYVQGIWEGLPNAWVKGSIEGNMVSFPMPQYLGTYTDEGTEYPIYFTAFDDKTGEMLRRLSFDYDETTGTLDRASSPISIGINKTGYLSVQDYYAPVLTRDPEDGIDRINEGSKEILRNGSVGTYDLSGRPSSRQRIAISKGRKWVK